MLAGYVFENDTGGSEAGPRGRKHDLSIRKKPEAAGASGGDPAERIDNGEPEAKEPQPTGRKRRRDRRNRTNQQRQEIEWEKNLSLPSRRGQVGLVRSQQPGQTETRLAQEASSEHRGVDALGTWTLGGTETEDEAAEATSPDRGSVRLHVSLFHFKRGFYSRTKIGEKGIKRKTAHIMNAVGNKAC